MFIFVLKSRYILYYLHVYNVHHTYVSLVHNHQDRNHYQQQHNKDFLAAAPLSFCYINFACSKCLSCTVSKHADQVFFNSGSTFFLHLAAAPRPPCLLSDQLIMLKLDEPSNQKILPGHPEDAEEEQSDEGTEAEGEDI